MTAKVSPPLPSKGPAIGEMLKQYDHIPLDELVTLLSKDFSRNEIQAGFKHYIDNHK